MSAQTPNEKILAAIPGLTSETLRISRQQWGKSNVMRQVIGELAEQQIEEARNGLESCESFEQMKDLQGQIKGIRSLLGMINHQGEL